MPRVYPAVDGYRAETAWGALDLGDIEGASVRVHWTDTPYKWHVNDGSEVFVVLAGAVRMAWREGGAEHSVVLNAGDAHFSGAGEEHMATPLGEARILVVEKRGSV